MIQLPSAPESPNIRALANRYRQSFTGLTVNTLTLDYFPVRTANDVGVEQVLLNGQKLDTPGDYTIAGRVITLIAPFGPLVLDDVLTVDYLYRS